MLIQFPYTQSYLWTALESGPLLLEHLLRDLRDDEADHLPDPERFTIREIVAHLADWDAIYLERMRRTVAQEHPVLPGYDPGVVALENGYAQRDVREQLGLFRQRRAELLAFLRSCGEEDWERVGDRSPDIGLISLGDQALLVPLHDAYHLQQIVEWRGVV